MDYEEVSKSKFNAGVAHTERLDALQRAINQAKFNPYVINTDTGTYNYEVMISACDCLVAEGWDKFDKKEKKKISRMNEALRNLMKEYPIISYGDETPIINPINYERFWILFQVMERYLKVLYGKHHLNSPTIDYDDEGL